MRDEAAFVEFAASSRAHLRRTAYLMCGDWERASDFVQEGLIRVYVRWPRLQEADHTTASGEDVATAVATRQALMSTLADLPPRQRACVVLRYFEDLSVAETAALLGCTEGTVKSQTSRALFSLRSVLSDSPTSEQAEGAVSW